MQTFRPSDNMTAANKPGDDDMWPRNQETEIPNQTTKILYRYLVKDEDGEILEKKESTEPIDIRLDDKATGLTDQTVLEVITTKRIITKFERRVHNSSLNTVVKIHSVYLINALREVIRYYPNLNLSGVSVTIEEPFMPLVHYMKELEDYKTNHPKGHDEDFISTTNSHIDILLGFLDMRLGQDLRLERERHQRQPPVTTFEYLWLLFRPGDQIFVKDNNTEEYLPYVFAMMHPSNIILGGDTDEFLVWRLDIFRGELSYYEEERRVLPFEGEKEISSLSLCPKDCLQNRSRIEEKCIARGKKVVSLFESSYMEYTGMTKEPRSIEVTFHPVPIWYYTNINR
jgi:hypothetical protein